MIKKPAPIRFDANARERLEHAAAELLWWRGLSEAHDADYDHGLTVGQLLLARAYWVAHEDGDGSTELVDDLTLEIERRRQLLGRAAGMKTCDDCGREYQGPAYYTFASGECVVVDGATLPVRSWDEVGDADFSPHVPCTGNLCADCAGPYLTPDRADDPRRPEASPEGPRVDPGASR